MLFLESPWPILIVGSVIEATLALALFRTGRGILLWAIGGVALLVLLGVFIEERTVTDTKLVRQTLEKAAAGLVANDAQRVNTCIAVGEDGDAARAKMKEAFAIAEFHEISIRSLEISFNQQTSSRTANTNLIVFVRGKAHGGEIIDLGEIAEPVRVQIELRKQSGHWLICGKPSWHERE